MKKTLALILALIIISALLLSGCSSSQTSAQSAPESAAEQAEQAEQAPSEPAEAEEDEAPAAPVKTVTLSFSTNNTEISTAGQYVQKWADKVKEITNGEVEFTIYYAGALVSESDIIESIKSGLVDAGEVAWAKQANALPMSSILLLPFSDIGNGVTFYENVFLPLIDDYPEFADEYQGLHIASFYVTKTSAALHTNGTPVRVPEDAKGLIISAQTSAQSQLTIDASASPVTLELSEWYTSLERGLIDGMWMSWGAVNGLELYKVMEYHTIFPSGYDRPITTFLLSDNAWSKLSAEAQEALSSIEFMEWCAETWEEMDTADFETVLANVETNGNTVIELTDEEEAQWIDLAQGTNDAYVAEYDSLGYPATAFYESFREYTQANR